MKCLAQNGAAATGGGGVPTIGDIQARVLPIGQGNPHYIVPAIPLELEQQNLIAGQ